MKINTPFVLMCLDGTVSPDEVLDYPYRTLAGKWRGDTTTTYCVPLERCRKVRGEQVEALKVTAGRYNQPSIMYVDEYNIGMLIDTDGGVDVIGRWQKVSKAHADELLDHTYDPDTDTYWAVERKTRGIV